MSRVALGVILGVGPELRIEGRGQQPLHFFTTPDLWTRAEEVDEQEPMLNIRCMSWMEVMHECFVLEKHRCGGREYLSGPMLRHPPEGGHKTGLVLKGVYLGEGDPEKG